MLGWEELRLGSLVSVRKGKLARLSPTARNGYLPYIGATALEGRIEAFAETSGGELATEKDVLMLWDGERSGLVGKGLQGVVGSTVARLTPRDGVDNNFLFHALSYKFKWIQALRTGTGVPHVPKDLCDILTIVLPMSIAEQRSIAEILDTVDEAIQRTEQLIAKLKAIKQGLLHDLLTRGLDENGQLRDPIAHPDQFKDTPLGKIPKEWQVNPVSSIGVIVTGTTPSGKIKNVWGDHLPFITPNEITEDGNIDLAERYLSINGAKFVRLIPHNSILVVCIGSTLGKMAIADEFCATNQQINTIIPNPNYDPYFIYAALVQFKEQLLRIAGLQAVPIVNKTIFSNISIPIASYKEQEKIGDIIKSIKSHINYEQRYLSKLKLIKKGLMHDLLTGKVRVNIREDNYDESKEGESL